MFRTVGAFNLSAAMALLAMSATGALSAGLPPRDMTSKDVTTLLYKAPAGKPPNLAGKMLSNLDLSDLNFKGADLRGANLFGSDLSGARLNHANLAGALLDRTTVVGAHFDGANLAGASLLRMSAFTSLTPTAAEAPSFRGADLSGAKLFGRFSLSNFSGANLTEAIGAPVNRTGFIEHIWRTELSGANLSRAQLYRADLTRALLSFANCRDADMREIILRDADLSGADMRGADLTGADVTGADLAGTDMRGARGLDLVVGMTHARNAEKMIR